MSAAAESKTSKTVVTLMLFDESTRSNRSKLSRTIYEAIKPILYVYSIHMHKYTSTSSEFQDSLLTTVTNKAKHNFPIQEL
jgi:hypothetical protein